MQHLKQNHICFSGDLTENDCEVIDSIENYCLNVALGVSKENLQNVFSDCNENHVLLFWKAVNDRSTDAVDPGERSI